VVAKLGVNGVTIRRVAGELGTSTSVITHFTRDKDDLLTRVISAELDDRRKQITDLVASAEDPLWAVVNWSVEADPDGVWPALVSATAAGVAPHIGQLVRDFDAWWTDLVSQLVKGRLIDGLSERDAADAIGVVADGLLLALSRRESSPTGPGGFHPDSLEGSGRNRVSAVGDGKASTLVLQVSPVRNEGFPAAATVGSR
jgi:AcrR family transcriptional regulator